MAAKTRNGWNPAGCCLDKKSISRWRLWPLAEPLCPLESGRLLPGQEIGLPLETLARGGAPVPAGTDGRCRANPNHDHGPFRLLLPSSYSYSYYSGAAREQPLQMLCVGFPDVHMLDLKHSCFPSCGLSVIATFGSIYGSQLVVAPNSL